MLLLDMLSQDIHPARRAFRKALLALMGLSFVFLLFVVGLRIHYRDGRIEGPVQTALFEADVLHHKARAFVGDDEEDMVVINSLLQLSVFSPIYTYAGIEMLEKKAETGYYPAVIRNEEIQTLIGRRPVQAQP